METNAVGAVKQQVSIAVGDGVLRGDLEVPPGAVGIVLFAHASGSSRTSPHNQYVAKVLHKARLATLLLDLLSEEEEREDDLTAAFRFDVGLLATRLAAAIRWVQASPELRQLPIGLFGASTGAAAALVAAAATQESVEAVVCRGGRPDLAGHTVALVRAATLLIVGGYDPTVLTLNRDALRQLVCEKRLSVVPRATHLFEEPGALEEVARLAQQWLVWHLAGEPAFDGALAG